MSKASEYASRKCPIFKDLDGKEAAWVDESGDLNVEPVCVDAKNIPAFITWLQDTFLDNPPSSESKYPCVKCGLLRTKAEGGTTFTVCDMCWDLK